MRLMLFYSRVACLLSATLLFLILSYQAVVLPSAAGGVLNASLSRIESSVVQTNTEAQGLIKNVNTSLDDNYYEMKAQAATTTVLLKDTSDLVKDTKANFFGGRDSKGVPMQGVVTEIRLLTSEATSLMASLKTDIHNVSGETVETLEPLQRSLSNLESLTATLDEQVKQGGPQAQQTVALMNQALVDIDKLLTDPDIQAILDHSARASGHLDSAAESVSIALEPWRRKASQLKFILSKLLSIVKIAIPVF